MMLVMVMSVMVVMAMLVVMLVLSKPLTVRQLHRSLQSRLQCRDVNLSGLVDHVVMGIQMSRGGYRAVMCRGCLRGQRHHRCRLVVVVIMIIMVVFWCVIIKTRAEDVVGLEVPEANITITARTCGSAQQTKYIKGCTEIRNACVDTVVQRRNSSQK